jgi:hypothetical protein
MASFPVELVYGVYLGLLTGIVPALVAWALGFAFRYVTGVTIPGFGVVGLAIAIAGAQGGLLALADPTFTGSENQIRLSVALLVVIAMALYTHAAGDRLGAALPKRITLQQLRQRTLSSDVVELVGGRGQVRVEVTGEVGDLEGYPPAPAELRTAVREGEWTFPADLPLAELESRFAETLRTEFDLPDVTVTLDERARATVAVAPPAAGLSTRVPSGRRAVPIETPVPVGLATGDEVRVDAGGRSVDGRIVGVRGGTPDGERDDGPADRVTVAVDRGAAEALLAAPIDRMLVRSRGARREFELVSLLRRAGGRFRRLTVASGGVLDGVTLEEAAVREAYGVAVLAVRHEGRWVVAPHGSQPVAAGDELYAVGPRDATATFAEAVA